MVYSVAIQSQDEIKVINFDHYTVGFNEKEKRTEWVSYRLTHEMVTAPAEGSRVAFYQEGKSLSSTEYTRSGFDRGHMAPFAHFNFSEEAGASTFSMLNIIPQSPFINRGIWRGIEEYERKIVEYYPCIYVLIKNDYTGTKKGKLNIPETMTKTVYTCEMEELASFIILNIK